MFSSKAQDADTPQPEAQEASGSGAEQQAEAGEQTLDPREQWLAEKEQLVCHDFLACVRQPDHQLTLLLMPKEAEYKDKLVRVLADMENLRERTNRQAEQSRQYAIQVGQDA